MKQPMGTKLDLIDLCFTLINLCLIHPNKLNIKKNCILSSRSHRNHSVV